jgi:hypothetical protein
MPKTERSPLNWTLMDMTETSAQPQLAVMRDSVLICFSVLGSVAIFMSGCAARKKTAIPWSTAVLVRPILPPRATANIDVDDPAPDLRFEIPPPPAPLATRIAPARPRSVAPSTNQNAPAAKPDTPQIVPGLSTQESASLRQETDKNLSSAERNLVATTGKSLNATQSDLASKIRSFISDAREAGRAGDWARARDLAKKAQVLSEELVGNL